MKRFANFACNERSGVVIYLVSTFHAKRFDDQVPSPDLYLLLLERSTNLTDSHCSSGALVSLSNTYTRGY